MGGASLPPGFRFHPTDDELVGYYLKRKTDGLEIELEVIPVVELYKFDPWELPEKSFLPSRDKEWFFFCVRDKKYPNGSRNNRATKCGYWKATGKDRKVVCQSGVIGYRKTLVFYRGRAPLGDRTNWVMHEYRIGDDGPQGSTSFQGPFALCRIIKKNEHPEKTSEADLGVASKKVCTGSSNGDFSSAIMLSETPMVSDDIQMQTSYMCNGSNFSTPMSSPYHTTGMGDYDHSSSMATNPSNLFVSPDMILDSSKEYSQGHAVPDSHQQFDIANLTSWQTYDPYDISSLNSNYNGEVELSDDLSRYGCASPFSFTGNYTGFFGNEDISYEGLEVWNQAQIYRQSSGDGVGGEFAGLWQQEDIVM